MALTSIAGVSGSAEERTRSADLGHGFSEQFELTTRFAVLLRERRVPRAERDRLLRQRVARDAQVDDLVCKSVALLDEGLDLEPVVVLDALEASVQRPGDVGVADDGRAINASVRTAVVAESALEHLRQARKTHSSESTDASSSTCAVDSSTSALNCDRCFSIPETVVRSSIDCRLSASAVFCSLSTAADRKSVV